MERISNYQLFTITVFFQMGSTVVFGFASGAGRDAWISVLISTALGMFAILLFLAIMRMLPGLSLVEWFPAQFGRLLGTPIAWLYPLLFLYSAGRGLADIKYLVPMTVLPGTPTWIVLGTFIVVVVYGLFSGIEAFGRITEYLFPVIFFIIFIEVILVFGSGIVHLENIQPFLDKGWGRIWQAVWPLGVMQGYAQTIELATIWPLVKQQDRILKTTMLATVLSGITIASLDLLAIAVLGEGMFQRSLYPLYLLIKQISIADFLENLDAIGVVYFIMSIYFKIFIHLYGTVRSIQLLLKIRDYRLVILPVSLIAFYLGMTMATGLTKHLYAGLEIHPRSLWIPFLALPALLLMVILIRKWSEKKQKKVNENGM